MRVLVVCMALAIVLAGAPTFAQTPAAPPAQPPAAQTAPAPKPFPQGASVAFVDIQRIVQQSAAGRAASGQVQALQLKKQAELGEKNRQLQSLQQKAQAGGVMNEQAQGELAKQIDKIQKDLERAQQDAQAELQELQQDLQADFQRKLMPVIQQVAAKKGLLMVFTPEAGIVWADSGIDITGEVIGAFDVANPPAATQSAPAPPPPAAAAAAAAPKPAAPAAKPPAGGAKPSAGTKPPGGRD